MKRVIVILLVAAFLVGVFSVPALAVKNDTPQGVKGNEGFYLWVAEQWYDHPGQMVQGLREAADTNIANWAKGQDLTVGEFLYVRVTDPGPVEP
jgi:hypothetical protein